MSDAGALETCLACRFFVRHTRFDNAVRAEVNLKYGDCRRLSPRARLSTDGKTVLPALWPRVRPEDFCGEYRSAP